MSEGKLPQRGDAQQSLKVIGLQYVVGVIELKTLLILCMLEEQRTKDASAPQSGCYLQFVKNTER